MGTVAIFLFNNSFQMKRIVENSLILYPLRTDVQNCVLLELISLQVRLTVALDVSVVSYLLIDQLFQ